VKSVLAVLLCLLSLSASAQDLYMVRSSLAFPETMALLQQTITEHGLKVSHVHRVDIGFTTFGYQTDKYRVVFFGDIGEIRQTAAQYPELLPYLPLKIAIFAEGDETILLASSFAHLRNNYRSPDLQLRFDRWESSIQGILEAVRTAE